MATYDEVLAGLAEARDMVHIETFLGVDEPILVVLLSPLDREDLLSSFDEQVLDRGIQVFVRPRFPREFGTHDDRDKPADYAIISRGSDGRVTREFVRLDFSALN